MSVARSSQQLLRRLNVQSLAAYRFCSSTAASAEEDAQKFHRTDEMLARNHNQFQVGKFFPVDPKILETYGPEQTRTEDKSKHLKVNYFATREWTERNESFGESCLMVRNPALEVINCIKHTDFQQPAIRYVLHGKSGHGKTMSLSHLLCYGEQEDFVVFKTIWIRKWLTRYYEIAPSTYKPGRIDHIVNSNYFLKAFRQANAKKLDKCVTHKDYTWSARDKIQAGSKLSDVVNLGCDRLNFAADALNVLIRELKLNCNAGNCKMMVLLDGVNALFADTTMIHKEKRHYEIGPYPEGGDWMQNVAKVDECSVLYNIKKLLMNDYKNAAIITSVDVNAEIKKQKLGGNPMKQKIRRMTPDDQSHLPFALLGEKGWNLMAPFYPVAVDKYSKDEMDCAIDYYLDKSWIRPECNNQNRRQELHFITGRIPSDFFKFSSMY